MSGRNGGIARRLRALETARGARGDGRCPGCGAAKGRAFDRAYLCRFADDPDAPAGLEVCPRCRRRLVYTITIDGPLRALAR